MSIFVAVSIAVVVLAPWLALLNRRGQGWRLRPREGDLSPPQAPPVWPPVRIIVPARNEAESLPATLPALLAQNYAGACEVVVVDDRSDDGTAQVAADVGVACGQSDRLRVLSGGALPAGWVGKPWALAQGVAARGRFTPAWLLFSDADIFHAEHSLSTLVAEAMQEGLVLNSRMARLRCHSVAERLLVPAYLYFFNLLYPMKRVNDPADSAAAAAGGCVLVDALELNAAGGIARIRDRIIDDIALARLLKQGGRRIRLALAQTSVRSLRAYDDDAGVWRGDVWRMVRRSAFTQLRGSWRLLALTLLMLVYVFVAPVLLVSLALLIPPAGNDGGAVLVFGAGVLSCAAMAYSYLPALRYFSLPAWRVLTLPWAAMLFACMTLDSAFASRRGQATGWRGRHSGDRQ